MWSRRALTCLAVLMLSTTIFAQTFYLAQPLEQDLPLSLTLPADLNQMMLQGWEEWDALTTRWFSLNGTLVDLYDYARRDQGHSSNTTLSGIGFYLLALANMYEETGNHYYLSKLRTIIDGLIANPLTYRDVVGFGEIFYVPTYYYDGVERDSSPTQTMLAAFASVKLWKWTQDTKYKLLAERVARESFSLAVPEANNATDLGWSQGYYSGRDLTNAKRSVFRQASITLFYSVFEKEVNSAYLTYVNRTLHWQFRAQLTSGGFAYHIGDTIENSAYTGVHILLLTWAYRLSPISFEGYVTNMGNALSWLQSLPIDTGYSQYMESYAITAALINGWKANHTVDATYTRTATYIGLKALDFTAYGAFTKETVVAYGWRLPDLYLGCFFSAYPLPDGHLEPSQISRLVDYSAFTSTDKNIEYAWRTDQGFDRFRGNSTFGVGLYQYSPSMPRTSYFFFGGSETLVASSVEKNLHYLKLRHTYIQGTVDQYLYANGLTVSEVTGSIAFRVYQEYMTTEAQPLIDITLKNGTQFVLNDYLNFAALDLGDRFIIRQRENPFNFFLVRSPNVTWTASVDTGTLYNTMKLKTTLTNGKILLARLYTQKVQVQDALVFLENYAPLFDQPNPVSFDNIIESYVQLKNQVGELKYGTPSWRETYRNATRDEVKIVALYLPEKTSVSQWNLIQKQLTATVQSSQPLSSTLKIYSGYKFSPLTLQINGTDQEWGTVWSFDSSTRTFTVNMSLTSTPLRLDVFFDQDLTPPTIFSMQRLIFNPEYNDTVTVVADISDLGQPTSGVGNVRLSYMGIVGWSNTTMLFNPNSSVYEGQIPPQSYGTFVEYRVYAADRAENWITSPTDFYTTTDTFAPEIKFVVPDSSKYLSGQAVIRVDCKEANFINMSLYIDDVFVQSWDVNGTQEYSAWDTTQFSDGSSHSLSLTAEDAAGNIANLLATVFTDNTGPSIEKVEWAPTNPLLGQVVTVKASVNDATSGVDSVNVRFREPSKTLVFARAQMTFTDGVWTATLEGSQSETTIEFFVEAFDKAGNWKQSQRQSYHVGNFPLSLLLLGILLGSALSGSVVAIILYYRKRKKKRQSQSTPQANASADSPPASEEQEK